MLRAAAWLASSRWTQRLLIWSVTALAVLGIVGVLVYPDWESKIFSGALALACGAIVLAQSRRPPSNTS